MAYIGLINGNTVMEKTGHQRAFPFEPPEVPVMLLDIALEGRARKFGFLEMEGPSASASVSSVDGPGVGEVRFRSIRCGGGTPISAIHSEVRYGKLRPSLIRLGN